ncbi:preprotein translocase subunit SecY, partial [Treponema endosymbiont of Eucomonympha sp.]
MPKNTILNMFRIKTLRSRMFFTFLLLIIFRLGSVLTIPGINPQALTLYFNSLTRGNNAFVHYMDFFAGGAFSNFSVFMLGVMPYISTQIIMQLALIIFPSLKRIVQEDGGQKKLQKWIRISTVFVCLLQSLAITYYAASIPSAIVITNQVFFRLFAMLAVTTGTMIAVWFGDQITARGIGNGISMLIFAGIIARFPSSIWELGNMVRNNDINIVFVIIVLIMFVGIIYFVIYEQQGQRKIAVHYAKRVIGRKMYGGANTYIPFKINPSGVIPVIFASSFLMFPLQIASSFGQNVRWVAKIAGILSPTGMWYNLFLVLLIVFFAYFYTQVTLNPIEIAKNIR